MSSFCREHIQCPQCGTLIRGKGKNTDAALVSASNDYLMHIKDGCLDMTTRDGLEAALEKIEQLLPGVTLTLSHSK